MEKWQGPLLRPANVGGKIRNGGNDLEASPLFFFVGEFPAVFAYLRGEIFGGYDYTVFSYRVGVGSVFPVHCGQRVLVVIGKGGRIKLYSFCFSLYILSSSLASFASRSALSRSCFSSKRRISDSSRA